MIDTSSKLYSISKVLGMLFLILYWLQDNLFNTFWIFGFIPLLLVGIGLLSSIIISTFRKNYAPLLVGLFTILSITIIEIFRSELLKSDKLLEANLDDDRSAIYLTLRENSKFELEYSFMFGSEFSRGNYKVEGNKIILLTKPAKSISIPDTLTVVNDKLVLNFDTLGQPIISFANYFTITSNNLKNQPSN